MKIIATLWLVTWCAVGLGTFALADADKPGTAAAPVTCGRVGGFATASEGHQHRDMVTGAVAVAPIFVPSTAKSFAVLMEDAMAVMNEGMRLAPMSGRQEHDFITMMIPHHQGAVDMAKALLLRATDPVMRNLALSMITEQQIEIQLMRQWLKDHPDTGSADGDSANALAAISTGRCAAPVNTVSKATP